MFIALLQAECICEKGFIGKQCISKCDVNPCLNAATCHTDYSLDKAYYCSCNSSLYSGIGDYFYFEFSLTIMCF